MTNQPHTGHVVASASCNDQTMILETFEPNFGAPFKIILINSVQQKINLDGDVVETIIPNVDGLLKEVAFERALDPRKFSPEDIKFVRKAVGLKALDLAELLGVSAEHISRCEKGDRILSVAAEKLLRVIVLKRRHNPAELANCLKVLLEKKDLSEKQKRKMIALTEKYRRTVEELETAIFDSKIQTVYPLGQIEYHFEVSHVSELDSEMADDDLEEVWSSKMAA